MNYTVFGLVDNTVTPRYLTVAAVVPGDVEPVDCEDYADESAQRFATTVDAANPDEAERLAIELAAEY